MRLNSLIIYMFFTAMTCQAATVAPPLAMADRSGQAMELARLDVRIASHGPLALTEMNLYFRNAQDHDVEGRFGCVLPAEATVSRFAWEIEGRLVEGEVVERKKAAKVYSAGYHSGSGGAMLSSERGSRFTAKVFPIRAKSTVRLLISYSTVNRKDREGRRKVEVPLVGLTKIGRFNFHAVCKTLPGEKLVTADWFGLVTKRERKEGEVVFQKSLRREEFNPATNIVFRYETEKSGKANHQIVSGNFVMSTVTVGGVLAAADSEPDEWHIMADTSASQASGSEARLLALAELIKAVEEKCVNRSSIVVSAFDIDVEQVLRWRAGKERGDEVQTLLRKRGFLGGTNLHRLFDKIKKTANQDQRRRVFILFSDLVPTDGQIGRAEMLKKLDNFPVQSQVHIITPWGGHDEPMVKAITSRTRGRSATLQVSTDTLSATRKIMEIFRRPEGENYEVSDANAQWIEPAKFRDVAPGEELVFFTKLRNSQKGPDTLLRSPSGAISKVTDLPQKEPTFGPLLEREAYRAYLGRLERQMYETYDYTKRNEIKNEQIKISTTYRVLCKHTALLILKSEEDYERYGIDRNALADIMVVTDEGIGLHKRAAKDLFIPTKEQLTPRKKPKNKTGYPTGRDPIIKLHAPADTKRVVAIFPWGLVKPMVKSPENGVWQVRFIIPKAMEHGDYDVILILTRGNGKKQKLIFSFGADKKAPSGAGNARVWRTKDGWIVSMSLLASKDVTRAEAMLPNGKTHSFIRTVCGRRWATRFKLADTYGASVMIPIVIFDSAHNRMVLEVEVELK